MTQRTWPDRSDGLRFASLPLETFNSRNLLQSASTDPQIKLHYHPERTFRSKNQMSLKDQQIKSRYKQGRDHPDHPILRDSLFKIHTYSSSSDRDFTAIPYDVMVRIGASFSLPNLQASSLVCKSWRDALCPLREAMLLLRWGKMFKHGRGGVRADLTKALDSFLKGAARGSSMAMVDAGLLYWEMGRKAEGIALYKKAAELGDHAGMCNLGITFLQGEPPNPAEAVKWLYRAAMDSHVRAQYQLALCFHQGRGVNRNLAEAARWYLRAAEGGYVRAMYNISLCYSLGEGLVHNHKHAKKWMKLAADHGHSKAQFEHGLGLFSEGEMLKAVVYLELANRAGETAAARVKNVIFQQLSVSSRERVMHLVKTWRSLSSSH